MKHTKPWYLRALRRQLLTLMGAAGAIAFLLAIPLFFGVVLSPVVVPIVLGMLISPAWFWLLILGIPVTTAAGKMAGDLWMRWFIDGDLIDALFDVADRITSWGSDDWA